VTPDRANAGPVTRIGKYEIIEELGHGGMGVVYRGIDKAIGREVAIKTLTEGFAEDPSMLSRFYDEVRITGNLNHPSIVTVYEVGDEHGTPYIVMECVKGRSLDKIMAAREEMALADRLRIIEQTCSALGYAHQNNVIHRDVKPANIFVLPDGNAKLLDFGIARLEKREQEHGHTRVGHLIGTIPYMAPERLRGETLDGRSDIFSVGVVLYQLIAGRLPFTGSDTALMQKILQEVPPTMEELGVECPGEVEGIIGRALAKDQSDRYSTAEEMAAEISSIVLELRQGQVQEMIAEARECVETDRLAQARTVLNQVLRLDTKNAAARELLAQVQKEFTQRKREMTAQQIRQQAEDAFASRRYDQCLAVLEGGGDLLTSYPDLDELRKKAQKEKEKQSRLNELVSQVESARRRGDFKNAIASAEKALKVDKTNPRIIALRNQLNAEAEQAQRQSQAKVLITAARGELSARRYPEAVDLLKQAETIDPTNPELPLMLDDARKAQEQSRRQEVISRLEEEVSQAATYEELQHVAQSIKGALEEMPAESRLFRLSAQVERLVRDYQNRKLVEDTVLAVRELRPREALDRVRRAQAQVPGDERLISLEALLSERLRQQSVEERRADYLVQAREFLGKQEFSDAVRVLEFCEGEGIASPEVLALLDFARGEEREHQRLTKLRNDMAHAQSLIDEADFDGAIEFLENTLKENEDQTLRMLLEQAMSGRESANKQIGNTLASVANLIQADKLDEAVRFVEMQPKFIKRARRTQAMLAIVLEAQQQAVFRALGRAYAALPVDLPQSETLMRQAENAVSDPAQLTALAETFRSRQQSFADAAINDAAASSRQLVRDRNREGAEKLLTTVSAILPFSSAKARLEWENARRKATASGMFSRTRS
jgi:eukaryotic-like serine/threonine-protein kinase